MFCTNCGREVESGAAFCVGCGTPVETGVTAPAVYPVVSGEMDREENAFLETTHRLLRWEQKAWRIGYKVFLILGIVFAAVFMLVFLIGLISAVGGDSYGGGVAAGVGLTYAIIFGGMFIVIGIICKKACGKVTQYLETVYTDFSITYKRCGSVGMLIFTILFGEVAAVFFIINFVRMKSNRAVIERIMRKQRV